ncbi:hypothetical protein QM467_17930 [Rhodoblastus sp. 17X3]|uniref:hypothetical protein n=1 Tax=Rhodoblastus sp. 17X3 TaxID=3047026 RepID=UPI0024B6B13C|nr:hypothetical protein [Rhodoblastus sp. 17X3]MDI9849924.1 hypothetical protein [Rhodoblastus sp. 17X3]
MTRTFFVLALLLAGAPAMAGERLNEGLMGAGAIVGGPVGAVAGGAVGYVAGPSIARGFHHNDHYHHHYRYE